MGKFGIYYFFTSAMMGHLLQRGYGKYGQENIGLRKRLEPVAADWRNHNRQRNTQVTWLYRALRFSVRALAERDLRSDGQKKKAPGKCSRSLCVEETMLQKLSLLDRQWQTGRSQLLIHTRD